MYLIVGLGNPGKKFELTRHNVGFEVIDLLSKKLDIPVTKTKFKALIGEGHYKGEKVILAKPQTFMNLSGEAVQGMLDFYNIELDHMIVVYDDIDTEPGKIRIRKKGSAGTHNGMRNIIYLIKKDDFPRVRIGIGKQKFGDLADYVLGRFPKEEIEMVGKSLDRAVEAIIETIEKKDIDLAMNKYNGNQ